MRSLRIAVWCLYVPATLLLTWLLTRLVVSISELVTIGPVDMRYLADHIVRTELPYAAIGALACYFLSGLFLAWNKTTAFAIFAEVASIGAAKTAGLVAVIYHLGGYGWRTWAGLLCMAFVWLMFLERRGVWPWRRMVRMLVLAVGVYLVVRDAAPF